MRALSSRPFCPCGGRRVSLRYLSAVGRDTAETSRKTLRQSLAQFTGGIRRYRNLLPTGELLRRAKVRVQGHLPYYANTDNAESCHRYMHLTRRVLCKWLNRRSQRKAYTWAAFQQALRHVGWPQVRIRVNLPPFATLHAGTKSRIWESHL